MSKYIYVVLLQFIFACGILLLVDGTYNALGWALMCPLMSTIIIHIVLKWERYQVPSESQVCPWCFRVLTDPTKTRYCNTKCEQEHVFYLRKKEFSDDHETDRIKDDDDTNS